MKLEEKLAEICNSCPLCNYARRNPQKLISKIVRWHGRWCPLWRSWEKIYGSGRKEV